MHVGGFCLSWTLSSVQNSHCVFLFLTFPSPTSKPFPSPWWCLYYKPAFRLSPDDPLSLRSGNPRSSLPLLCPALFCLMSHEVLHVYLLRTGFLCSLALAVIYCQDYLISLLTGFTLRGLLFLTCP